MTYGEAFDYIMTNSDSPFSNMEIYTNTNGNSISSDVLRTIAMTLCRGMTVLVNYMHEFVAYCYKFISFSNSPAVNEIYSILTNHLYIPISVCLIIIAIALLFNQGKRNEVKKYFQNLIILFLVVCILPSIFSFLNNDIFGDDFYSDDGNTVVDSTLVANTTDYVWLYDSYINGSYRYNQVLKNISDNLDNSKQGNVSQAELDGIIEELQALNKNYADSKLADHVKFTILSFDYNGYIDSKMYSSVCTDSELPNFFKYRAITTLYGIELMRLNEPIDIMGITKLDIQSQYYMRYKISIFTCFLQLLAELIMYFCIGFSVLSIIISLIFQANTAPVIAAMDLLGGTRIKKLLSSILGCYVLLLLTSIVMIIYSAASDWLNKSNVPPTIRVIMLLVLAIIILDVPNQIGRYFGVNSGIKGGMAIAGGFMYAMNRIAGNTAKGAVNSAAGAAVGGALGGKLGAAQGAVGGIRGAVQSWVNGKQNAKREQEQNAREAFRTNQANADKATAYQTKADKWKQQLGNDGDVDKYSKPINPTETTAYGKGDNPDKPIDTRHKDAIVQQAAINDMKNSADDKKVDKEELIDTAIDYTTRTKNGHNDKEGNRADHKNKAAYDIKATDIKAAQYGMNATIAEKAKANGGKKEDYVKAAGEWLEEQRGFTNNTRPETQKQREFIADTAMNHANAEHIRSVAQNIQSDMRGLNDTQAYTLALQEVSENENLHFNPDNIQRIAEHEISYGSLRQGNIYSNRPQKPVYKSPYQYNANTQTSAFK